MYITIVSYYQQHEPFSRFFCYSFLKSILFSYYFNAAYTIIFWHSSATASNNSSMPLSSLALVSFSYAPMLLA